MKIPDCSPSSNHTNKLFDQVESNLACNSGKRVEIAFSPSGKDHPSPYPYGSLRCNVQPASQLGFNSGCLLTQLRMWFQSKYHWCKLPMGPLELFFAAPKTVLQSCNHWSPNFFLKERTTGFCPNPQQKPAN